MARPPTPRTELDERLQEYVEEERAHGDRSWPPRPIPAPRSRRSAPSVLVDADVVVERASKRFGWVWAILGIVGAAAVGGWKVHDWFGGANGYVTAAGLRPTQDDVRALKTSYDTLDKSLAVTRAEMVGLKESIVELKNSLDRRAPDLVGTRRK